MSVSAFRQKDLWENVLTLYKSKFRIHCFYSFITTIWEMHVISPIFLRLLPFMKKRLYFWRFHKEQHTCMKESQLWHWETNLIVYSVQSSNRKFRMFHYFYPFEDTSTLVEDLFPLFSLIFGQDISLSTHGWWHCVSTPAPVTRSPASFTVHFTDTLK